MSRKKTSNSKSNRTSARRSRAHAAPEAIDAKTLVVSSDRSVAESASSVISPEAGDDPASPASAFSIVGVGASAGGLDAFLHVLSTLPHDANLAVIFVQHLLADRKSELPHLLTSQTPWPVIEATDGREIEPRRIYVIPPNTTLEVSDGHLRLAPRAPEYGHHHLPVDHLFRSLAQSAQDKAIGVVLSGTGSDGATGVREIRAVGGIAIAQLPDTAQYDGMPRAAIGTDAVDLVLPPAEIGHELARLAAHGFARHVRSDKRDDHLAVDEEHLRRVFTILRAANGVDFKHYKLPTIRRRLNRRMALQKIKKVEEYIRFIEQNPSEVEFLYRDLLIHVTRFFREPESFETLKQLVFPKLLENRKDNRPIRIWVPGCSTGEEPYSIAISLLELVGDRHVDLPIQIFATDLSEAAVDRARAGVYPDAIAEDLSADRIRRFFVRTDGSYQISKAVRDMCIFARQDLTRDPPFSKLDLIVCRNVLIYLNIQMQKKLMGIFHYALKPTGFLMLGAAETIGTHADLFAVADKKHRVFVKISTHHSPVMTFPAEYHAPRPELDRRAALEPRIATNIQDVNRILLERFAPPGVVVNEQLQILYFQGQTGKYLEPAAGDASLSLLKMAREGILYGLRTAIRDARKTGRAVRHERLSLQSDGQETEVHIEVIPLVQGSQERHFLILFEDAMPGGRAPAKPVRPSPKKSKVSTGRQSDQRLAVLQQELKASRDYMQSIIQDFEAANEELQSANEEILSSNEELQSTNEELDTAKEELQSTNEELNTVNEELHKRNEDLTRINSDLVNILSSIQIAIVIVSSDLRIRRFTPMAERLFNLIPGDVGRPISQIKPNFACPDLEQVIVESLESATPIARDVQEPSGRWFSLNVRPYKTIDNRIDGAVIGLFDVDTQKREERS